MRDKGLPRCDVPPRRQGRRTQARGGALSIFLMHKHFQGRHICAIYRHCALIVCIVNTSNGVCWRSARWSGESSRAHPAVSSGCIASCNVRVVVNCTPLIIYCRLSEKERLEGCSDAVVVHPESNIIEMQEWVEGGARGRKRAARQYGFDNVFAPNSTQQEIYDQIGKPICTDFLRGYNATLLAYGQVSRATLGSAAVCALQHAFFTSNFKY